MAVTSQSDGCRRIRKPYSEHVRTRIDVPNTTEQGLVLQGLRTRTCVPGMHWLFSGWVFHNVMAYPKIGSCGDKIGSVDPMVIKPVQSITVLDSCCHVTRIINW